MTVQLKNTWLMVIAVPSTGKYFVLATTPTRLYQFQGYVSSSSERPLLQQVFCSDLYAVEKCCENRFVGLYMSNPCNWSWYISHKVFSNYLHVPERFLELPSSLKTSTLSFHWASPPRYVLLSWAKASPTLIFYHHFIYRAGFVIYCYSYVYLSPFQQRACAGS